MQAQRVAGSNRVSNSGAELKWLSAFPGEEEVLFPPLTYLQPTGREQHIDLDGGCSFHVVEVQAYLP